MRGKADVTERVRVRGCSGEGCFILLFHFEEWGVTRDSDRARERDEKQTKEYVP